jgi:hypothetical protein
MLKLASFALSATLGVAGLMHSVPAAADPTVTVGVPAVGVGVVAPRVVAYGRWPGRYVYGRPYYRGFGPYYGGPYIGFGYARGFGYRPWGGYGFRGGYWHGGWGWHR